MILVAHDDDVYIESKGKVEKGYRTFSQKLV